MQQANKSQPKFLEVKKRVDEIRSRYEIGSSQTVNMLVIGDYGTGKTQLAATCPTPVFIDSFDPGGTKTRALQPAIKKGDIIVEDKWEKDSWKDPWAFREWEKEMESRMREDFFNAFSWYILDSCTKWAFSLMYEILKKGGRAGKGPQIQDYLVQQLTAADWLGQLMDLPCNVMVTGHIAVDKDEVTGKMETGLLMWGKLAQQVPLVFDEKYVCKVEQKPTGPEHQLLTKNDGIYKAETRMGGDLFNQYEAMDIRTLLKKAGKPSEDKPSLFEEG
jgi:hypothetical protein